MFWRVAFVTRFMGSEMGNALKRFENRADIESKRHPRMPIDTQ